MSRVVVVVAPSAQGFDPRRVLLNGDVLFVNASQVPTTYNSYEGATRGPKFSPSMAVIVVVLVGAFIFVAFFSVYMRRCARGVQHVNSSARVVQRRVEAAAAAAAAAASEDQLALNLYRGRGIDKALVEALPVVSYAVVKESLKKGRRGESKESLDCAVCLNEFDQDENLRLLPGCNHAFHLDCIDVWFQSHSTCPLCRSNLLPIFKELIEGGGPAAIGEVSRRMLEAAEEAFSSAREGGIPDLTRSFNGIPQTADEDTTEGRSGGSEMGSQIAKVGERHSARLALSRNSESFRQAARGVELREMLAASSARYPSLAPIVDNYPRRASSLKFPNFSGKDLYEVEMLPYGSRRFGAYCSAEVLETGASSAASSVGELQRAENSENTSGGGRFEEKCLLSGLTSPRDEDEWITIDIALDQNSPQPRSRSMKLPIDMQDARNGKSLTNVGGAMEVRAASDRWSFSSLRGPFSLSRSASDRRPQLSVPMQLEGVHQAVVPPPQSAVFNPLEQTQQGGGAALARQSSRTRSIRSFATRTMQWLAGSGRSSNTATAVQATPSQQSITPQ